MAKQKGVKENQGRVKDMDANVYKTIDTGGKSDGGGSKDVARAAKSINVGNRKGGAPGL